MSDGVIRMKCPNLLCGRILSVPGNARGKRVRCRGCSTVLSVPPKAPDRATEASSSERDR